MKLARARDPLALLKTWNRWVQECEALGQSPNDVPLSAAFGALAQSNPTRGRDLAEYMVGHDLAIGRFAGELLDSLSRDDAGWALIEEWASHVSPSVRVFAASAVSHAPQGQGRRLIEQLSNDPDPKVRDIIWRGVVYYSDEPFQGWRLMLALKVTEASESPLEPLLQVLQKLRFQTDSDGAKVALTKTQKAVVKRILLSSARSDALPGNHQLKMALEEVEALGSNLVLPWLRARLEHLRTRSSGERYMTPVPEELQPLL